MKPLNKKIETNKYEKEFDPKIEDLIKNTQNKQKNISMYESRLYLFTQEMKSKLKSIVFEEVAALIKKSISKIK